MSRARPTPGEIATVVLVAGLLVVAVPQVGALYWSPKVAIGLLAIGPGLAALAVAALTGDRAAQAGAGLLGVAALATVLSPSPALAVVGLYNEGTGLVFVALVVAAWALGRRLRAAGRDLLVWVLLGAGLVNAVMAWLQMSHVRNAPLFDRLDGRAVGLLGNPVHATAFLVGVVALAAERWPGRRGPDARPEGEAQVDDRARSWLNLATIAILASAVQLTGGRIGLVLMAVVLVRLVVRVGIRGAMPVLGVLAVGVVVAVVALPSGTGAAGRLASGESGGAIGGRIDRWSMAVPAVRDRPVLGVGPGLYRRATSPHTTTAAARAFGADSVNRDAHNVLVQAIVTMGVLGLLAFGLWVVLAAFGSGGELLWFVIVGGASLLFQPLYVGLTPVLALAFGAAGAREPRPMGTPLVVLATLLALVGGTAGVALLRADRLLELASVDSELAAARAAPGALPVWSEPYTVLSRLETRLATTRDEPVRRRLAIDAARHATERDPSDPGVWILLGRLELDRGRWDRAERALSEARRWNPRSTAALGGLAAIAEASGRHARADALCRTARAARPHLTCPEPLSRRGG